MKRGDLAQLVPSLDMAMASKHAYPLSLGHPDPTVRIERGQILVVIEVQTLPKFSVARTAGLGNDVVVLAGDQIVHIREGLIRVVGEGE